MSNSQSQANWMTWYPQEIFLKHVKNEQMILVDLKKLHKKDFCTNIQQKDTHYNEHELQIKMEMISQKKYEEGFNQGILESKLECDQLKNKLNGLCLAFENNFANYQNELYVELLKIVFKISSYVIGQEINIDKSILLNHIKKFVNENSYFLKKPRIIVHPENKILIENILKTFVHDCQWKLEYDKNIDLNGCRIISEDSCLDNTIKARWHELYRLIFSEEY